MTAAHVTRNHEFFRIISKIGAARSMTITYLVSVIATVLGLYVFNESITILMVLSALLVLLGTALSSGLIQKSKPSEITY